MSIQSEATDFSYVNGSLYVAVQGKLFKVELPQAGLDDSKALMPSLFYEDGISEFLIFDSNLQRGYYLIKLLLKMFKSYIY